MFSEFNHDKERAVLRATTHQVDDVLVRSNRLHQLQFFHKGDQVRIGVPLCKQPMKKINSNWFENYEKYSVAQFKPGNTKRESEKVISN